MSTRNPFEILGIESTSSVTDIQAAWRKRAVRCHPDSGGSHEQMVELNWALDTALRNTPATETKKTTNKSQIHPHRGHSVVSRDYSSFTISLLPVEAWEQIVLAAHQLGAVLDEDEPYVLEFALYDSSVEHLLSSYCRCELMPEAGATTVHLSVISETSRTGDVETVRDLLVSLINLDYTVG